MPSQAKKEAFPAITGKVVHGDGRGRAFGFPTANLLLDDPAARPPDGIYAGWAQLEGATEWLPAAIHVGPRPTFPGALPSIEVHLLEYAGPSFYNQRLTVECHHYLRPIRAFSSIEELQQAIAADSANARALRDISKERQSE